MEAFKAERVVGDVIDAVPSEILQVKFGDVDITPGKVMTPTQVKDQPKLAWAADPNAFYTILFNDPDAPSREDPKFGEFHHWLVTNVPGSDVSKGDVMSEYLSSGPGQGSGLHRYVLLVYKQSQGRQNFDGVEKLTNRSVAGRRSWKSRDFSKKYNLGDPIAANFYQAEYDEYCLVVRKQLGL